MVALLGTAIFGQERRLAVASRAAFKITVVGQVRRALVCSVLHALLTDVKMTYRQLRATPRISQDQDRFSHLLSQMASTSATEHGSQSTTHLPICRVSRQTSQVHLQFVARIATTCSPNLTPTPIPPTRHISLQHRVPLPSLVDHRKRTF